ncbi:MAG: NADPH-dependent F420 reductase [Chromatiales bacterium]|jgi:NADPH-dependent F420 reductase|nr:NADPH-dependent F420 reductase [Chromatiales bacterium]
MNDIAIPSTVAIVGGTGALGGGLARRLARAGLTVVIGSRDAAKAAAAATSLAAALPGSRVTGLGNLAAASAAGLVVLAVPFANHRATLQEIAPALAGKILVDTTVPLVPPRVARVQLPPEGCAALAAQQLLGDGVTVVSAFQNVSADSLQSDEELDCDVLVTGNKAEAREVVVGLAERAGLRAWHAGSLENSAAAEALTSVLIFMNKRYGGVHTGIRITGIGDGAAG